MLTDIFTTEHTVYVAIGCALEYFADWSIARIKLLSKTPTASLSSDAIALIEKLIESHLAMQKVATITQPSANSNTTPTA